MLNRWVLSRDRKSATEGAEVTRSGRLFQTRAAASGKARMTLDAADISELVSVYWELCYVCWRELCCRRVTERASSTLLVLIQSRCRWRVLTCLQSAACSLQCSPNSNTVDAGDDDAVHTHNSLRPTQLLVTCVRHYTIRSNVQSK